MADSTVVQTIKDAEIDARSLSEFISKDASFMVTRRLAPTVHTLDYYINRLNAAIGNADYTANSLTVKFEQGLEDAINSVGYFIVGTFTEGATLNGFNDVIKASDGNLYRWGGDLPKTVPSGSTPEGTGGFSLDKWALVSGQVIDSRVADIESDVDTLKNRGVNYNYTMMGKAFDSYEGVGDVSAHWTHATVAYDKSRDKVVLFYNTNSGHNITHCSVLMRTKDADSEEFSEPSVVASNKGVTSYKTQAAGIAANGDYIALVAKFPWGVNNNQECYVYRSTDGGQTFIPEPMMFNGEFIKSYNGDVSGFLVTGSGRILTFAVEAGSMNSRIFYSDDHGITWHQSSIAGNPKDVTEPAWCDLGGGKLICMARAQVRFGVPDYGREPAKFMRSDDNGTTWSNPVNSEYITDFTGSNGHMFYLKDQGHIEFIHHSRRTIDKEKGLSPLYRSYSNADDAWEGKFSPQVVIGKMASYLTLPDGRGDSGYVGGAIDKNGLINIFYYTGKRTNSNIAWVVGTRGTKFNYLPDYDYHNMLAGDTSGQGSLKEQDIYNPKIPTDSASFVSYNVEGAKEARVYSRYHYREQTAPKSSSPDKNSYCRTYYGVVGTDERYIGYDLTDVDYIACNYSSNMLNEDNNFNADTGYNDFDFVSAIRKDPISTSPRLQTVVAKEPSGCAVIDVRGFSGRYFLEVTSNNRRTDKPCILKIERVRFIKSEAIYTGSTAVDISQSYFIDSKIGGLGLYGAEHKTLYPSGVTDSNLIVALDDSGGRTSLKTKLIKHIEPIKDIASLIRFRAAMPVDSKFLTIGINMPSLVRLSPISSINLYITDKVTLTDVESTSGLGMAIDRATNVGITPNGFEFSFDVKSVRQQFIDANGLPNDVNLFLLVLVRHSYDATDSLDKPHNRIYSFDYLYTTSEAQVDHLNRLL